ncbi:MAG: class I SAM-dependent methyltransferase [Phycisphaerales bacterium]|nr:class I SAM-dependent methyltransferase [Phycisphaerales bacterium]
MIVADGWSTYSIWAHSASVRDLYRRRCRMEEPEMDCAAQAADLLATVARSGESILDVGCGAGSFLHSLRRRHLDLDYLGIDADPTFIDIGRTELAPYGLRPEQLRVMRIEDLDGTVDHVLCLNVLTNLDNFHRPLERMLRCARRGVLLRESIAATSSYHYVRDEYLDDGVDLRVHVNTYARDEITSFIRSFGFDVECITDRRTQGRPELVIGHPHHWTFVHARRRTDQESAA